jgi:putative ABC transport system permease protein
VLGTALSTITLIPFSVAVSGSARPSGPVWLYLAVAGTACALVLVATLVPTWLSLRSRPVVAASANAP